jgi:hypothetical protein
LISVCTATKRDGSPCTLPPNGSGALCWAHHDPTNAERRRRGQSRGGKSKPGKEIVAIRGRLSDLADDVLAGRVDRADAAVAGQLLGTVIRAIGTELRVREQEEILGRVAELEALLESQNEGGRRWG